MMPVKRFNLLVLILPVLYLFHNFEELIVFSKQADKIGLMLPNILKTTIEQNPNKLILVFSIGLVFATVLPLTASLLLWGKPTIVNIKIMIVIALATLINGLSHISSSIVLGFFSPGLITAISLCLPYSIWVLVSTKESVEVSIKSYLFLFLLAAMLYVVSILISWLVGFGLTS